MKQETNDTIINVITEWTQYKVNLNWDVNCYDMIQQFVGIMRSMTYSTVSIINSLKQLAGELEMDTGIDNNNENNDIDYATTD